MSTQQGIAADDYILVCTGISKAFGGTQALDNVDFRVKRGEVHALLGGNGAGKSTLMKIIMGLHSRTAGASSLMGVPTWCGARRMR
jgi:ABC-type sugar transport system ATPase subunit